jgi:hypothetical protein
MLNEKVVADFDAHKVAEERQETRQDLLLGVTIEKWPRQNSSHPRNMG